MRQLDIYIVEKLKLNKDIKLDDRSELFILIDNWCKKNIKDKYDLTSDADKVGSENTEYLYLKVPGKNNGQLQVISQNLQHDLSDALSDNDKVIWSFLDEDTHKILIFKR